MKTYRWPTIFAFWHIVLPRFILIFEDCYLYYKENDIRHLTLICIVYITNGRKTLYAYSQILSAATQIQLVENCDKYR